MSVIYSASLTSNQLAWDPKGDPPVLAGQAIPVQVMLTIPETETEPNGPVMAAIMEEFAARGGPTSFGDPVEWQREQRKGRPLPGRDE